MRWTHDLQWWAPLKRIEDLFIKPRLVMPKITGVKRVDIEGGYFFRKTKF